MTTKQELHPTKNGRRGTIVRLTVPEGDIDAIVDAADRGYVISRETYVVKDLFDRKNWNKPTSVGIGPRDMGIAFSVELDQIEIVEA